MSSVRVMIYLKVVKVQAVLLKFNHTFNKLLDLCVSVCVYELVCVCLCEGMCVYVCTSMHAHVFVCVCVRVWCACVCKLLYL